MKHDSFLTAGPQAASVLSEFCFFTFIEKLGSLMPFCGTYDAIRSSTNAFTQTTLERAKIVAGVDCKSVYVCSC